MIDRELRDLVRRMCEENLLWGAPRIHSEPPIANPGPPQRVYSLSLPM
jgi:hypothetical protein